MALATRCPKCGTTFRVVRDQIKLREGWVRCGVCSTPFDSHASLIEIDVPATPAPVEPSMAAQAPVAEPHSAQPAPPAPDPIEDHPAVLRTRAPRHPAGQAGGQTTAGLAAAALPGTPERNAPAAAGFAGGGIQMPRDDEANFGPVPDLYPAAEAARRAASPVDPQPAAPTFVPAAPAVSPAAPARSATSAPPVTPPSPQPPPVAPAAPVAPSAAPAPFVPNPTFRADTEAASAAHLRAALGQGGAASGRTEPSVWAGESGSSAHVASRGAEPSLRAKEPTFDPQIASLRANEPSFESRPTPPRSAEPIFEARDTSPRGAEPTFGDAPSRAADTSHRATDPVLRQSEPTFGDAPLRAADTSHRATDPFSRQTEPTFGTPPLPRDDREPRFVIADMSDDPDDNTAPTIDPTFSTDAAVPPSPGFMAAPDDVEPSRWRWVWIVLAVLLVLVLLGQSIWLYRTELATWFPAMRPALEKACVRLDCTVSYPRDPRQLTIESSALETWSPEPAAGGAAGTADGTGPTAIGAAAGSSDTTASSTASPSSATPGVRHLALRVTLRNRAKHPQPWPALELSLTDFSETVVSRRVLLPSAYLPPQQLADPIPAGQEQSLRIPIDTTEARASGYRVAAFFP